MANTILGQWNLWANEHTHNENPSNSSALCLSDPLGLSHTHWVTLGHYGNAGLLGFADPDAKLSFCYTMNRQGRAWRDPRNIALVDALYSSINNHRSG